MSALIHPLVKVKKEHWVPGLLLFFALIHGLIYTFLVPPWQHYDEPGQFEYAWLLANHQGHLTPGDYDQSMRREVAASMLESGFFRDMEFRPNLITSTGPTWIGISQLNDLPLYYFIVSLPLRLLKYTDIGLQLYSARLVSLLLYLIIILTTWEISKEIFSTQNHLSWMVPAFLVLLPGFVDMMTAVNNDVGATALFSIFLWASIRLIKNKFSILNVTVLLVMLPLSFLTKDTIFVVLPITLVVILFSLLRERKRHIELGVLFAALAIILLTGFRYDNAAYWYNTEIQLTPDRIRSPDAPLGHYAIQLDITEYPSFQSLKQLIPTDNIPSLEGSNITLGAWIWASKPVQITIPYISTAESDIRPAQKITIGTTPFFYAFQQHLPDSISRLWITLMPTIMEKQSQITIYYDGLTVAKGLRPLQEKPSFDDAEGNTGIWGGKQFRNLLRNGSGESPWPRLQFWIDQIGAKYFPGKPSTILASLLDWDGTRTYFKWTAYNLFTTFWARFGWGNVPLITDQAAYYILMGVTFLGVAGAVMGFFTRTNYLSIEIILLFIISLISIWGLTLIRGIPTLFEHLFLPSARYAYPAIVPVSIFLNMGWHELFQFIRRRLWIPEYIATILYFGFFAFLDSLAIITLIAHYYRR